ncbi:MAG: hypothetical protein WCJ09_28560, partial [Planctomycetota bacterium]
MALSFRFFLRLFTPASVLTLFISVAGTNGTANEPATNGFQPVATIYRNARIVLAPGQVLDNAHLLVRNGRIAAVGADIPTPV